MKKLYLIDGSGFIFRAYHSLPPLIRSDGTPTGAVYGFVNMMLKIVEDAKADYIAVIFDAGRKTFRNRIYPEYKAHRPPAPDDLIPQFPLVREATEALNLPAIELADFEADDIIATYTKLAREQNLEVIIVSSDKDLMQLVGENVSMYDGMKQKIISTEQVIEKFGVTPDKVRDVLALIGDTSDNVPGVAGIGPKTAAELIIEYGNLEAVLNNTANIKQNKRRETLENSKEIARLSYELIGLCENVPLPFSILDLQTREPDHEKLLTFLRNMQFKSLVNKIETKHGVVSKTVPTLVQNHSKTYELVQDEATLKTWLAKAKYAGVVAFDTETNSLDAISAELVGFSLCVEAGKSCYVPLNHVSGKTATAQGNLFEPAPQITRLENQIDFNTAISLLKEMLADPSILKIGHNIKYDMLVLKKYGINILAIDDTMLLSYILDAGKHNHNMDDLAQKHLGIKTISYDEITGTGKARLSFAEVDLEKACAYAAEDADITMRLWQKLKPQVIAEQNTTLYETIERPLISTIVAMEGWGIKIDRFKLSELSQDFSKRIAALELEIHALAGVSFNIGSPKQLGEVLFEKLAIEGGKKSKLGAYTTSVEVLEELAENGNKIADKVLEWRQFSKLKSTYTDTLITQINPKTARVHTSYAMASTSTGRLSSSNPNLQNIPIRSDEGRKIRSAFVADTGNKLISADYSQIELRLLADIAGIETLKEAFRNSQDIHAITASQMFGVPVEQVSSDLRRKAKTINFGIIYGISAHGLATRLGISRSEAATYIESYFKQYPGIADYMEKTKIFARKNGFVTTLFGRKCHINGINDKNGSIRNFSERAAINAPLQGSAADIIKLAMIAVEKQLQGSQAKMLLQVHDELIIETPTEIAQTTATKLKHIMENVAHLSVPLTVDAKIGDNWNEAH